MITDPAAAAWPAFVRGLWFDNVIACYIMILPTALLLCCTALGYVRRWQYRFAQLWASAFFVLTMAISAANIPYFAYFFKNINASIFEWTDYVGTTTGMLLGERSYIGYILLFFVMAALYTWILWRLMRASWHTLSDEEKGAARPWLYAVRIVAALVVVGLYLVGIRGRMGYNPIKVSEAYYCNDPLLNQLGISPTFNLLTSALDDLRKENKALRLMPQAQAIADVQRSLGITPGGGKGANVLRRHITAADSVVRARRATGRPNVVIILMESMSAGLVQSLGGEPGLTPTLDSLYHHSLAFDHFYSAGVHTNHGLTATLYSFPALMFRNLMKGTVTPRREGIPTVLKREGYHNLFFMTHESQYDNMNAFFRTNGYDEIYSQENYPRSARVNSFGVPDQYLFDYALPVLNRQARTGHPFMATLLTISNHPPYIVPDAFKRPGGREEDEIVRYADHCIGRFLSRARREAWYDNTVFVVLADHGKLVGKADADLPQSYNHIPCFIFGAGIRPHIYEGLGTQVDVMPTLLGLLGVSYDYDGFGVDLLRTRRDMVYYSADDVLVGRSRDACYLYRPATDKSSYYDVTPAGTLKPAPPSRRFAPLRQYAFSMAQTATYLLSEDRR